MTTKIDFISVSQAAELAKVSTTQIRRLISRGVLEEFYRPELPMKVIKRESFDHWLANRRPAGAPRKQYIKINGQLFKRVETEEAIGE